MVFGYNRLVIHQILGTETGHSEDNAMNWQNERNITQLHVKRDSRVNGLCAPLKAGHNI